MGPPRIEAISTSPREQSRSRSVLELAVAVLDQAGAEVRLTDIRDFPVVLCRGGDIGSYPEPYQELAQRIGQADGVVIAAPIHNYSVAGGCRNLVEIVSDSFAGAPVAVVTGAGSVRSHLAHTDFLIGLQLECRAHTYQHTIQLTGNALPEELQALPDRTVRFVSGFLDYCRRFPRSAPG